MEFGTGCVKITPAHDPNDFEVGKRHNLEEINILNDDATLNEKGGKYAGMDRYEARKAMVADLEKEGLLVKVVPHTHNVGTHDRCKTTVEPMIKPQWFVRMKEMGQAALDLIKTDELEFVPEQFDKTYIHWLENIRDWCISRQTDVLVTGYDIIFFWVIRMVFSALEQTGKSPFKHVLIHGLVRDDQGRKMSKSLGNGIDPLEAIDKYGADALRLTLITGNAPGNDMRFYWERVENSRNFANKIWNASRFIMMNMEKADFSNVKLSDLTIADRWILSKVNDLAVEMTDNMEKYELGIAVSKVYDFIWEEFCDWYIEMVKPRLYNDADETKAAALWTLKTVLIRALKLLHPYMPFITEEIFCNIQDEEESIMISDWPVYKEEWSFKQDENAVDTIKSAVRAIRNLRTGMNVPPSKKATVYVVSAKSEIRDIFEASKNFFATLGYASEVFIQDSKNGIDENAVSTLIHDAALYIPLAELVDIDKEIERLEKESGRLAGEIKRASGMLANPKFVDKAPAAKVEEEKAKLAKYTEMKAQVEERLAQLKK